MIDGVATKKEQLKVELAENHRNSLHSGGADKWGAINFRCTLMSDTIC